MDATYISCAGTAKLIRSALKAQFPGVKFSVRCHGRAINIDWFDGPTRDQVDAIAKPFSGATFDGSIDLQVSVRAWLLPDGTATFASSEGTEGSGGGIPAIREWMPVAGAKLVRFSADFIFTSRKLSPEFAKRILAATVRRHGEKGLSVKVSDWDGSATISGDWDAEREAYTIERRFVSVRAVARECVA